MISNLWLGAFVGLLLAALVAPIFVLMFIFWNRSSLGSNFGMMASLMITFLAPMKIRVYLIEYGPAAGFFWGAYVLSFIAIILLCACLLVGKQSNSEHVSDE